MIRNHYTKIYLSLFGEAVVFIINCFYFDRACDCFSLATFPVDPRFILFYHASRIKCSNLS